MISRWAPPVENHTEAYIRAVAADTGIDPDEPLDTLDPATMIPWPPPSRAWKTARRRTAAKSSAAGRCFPIDFAIFTAQ